MDRLKGEFILVLSMTLLQSVLGAGEQTHACGACLAIVDEINWKIREMGPKKTIQIGSFRVDPSGKQNLREIPYSRSETFLTDAFDTVCEKMSEYAQNHNTNMQRRHFVRTTAFDGEPIQLEFVTMSGDVGGRLKTACGNFLEEYEDEVINLFRRNETDMEIKTCVELSKVCKNEDILLKFLWDSKIEERKLLAKKQKEEDEWKKIEEEKERKRKEKEAAEEEERKKKKKKEDEDDDEDEDEDWEEEEEERKGEEKEEENKDEEERRGEEKEEENKDEEERNGEEKEEANKDEERKGEEKEKNQEEKEEDIKENDEEVNKKTDHTEL